MLESSVSASRNRNMWHPLGKYCLLITTLLHRLYNLPQMQPALRRFKTPSIQDGLAFLKGHFGDRQDLIILEIGARYGESSSALIRVLNVKTLHIVDPYESYGDYSHDPFNISVKKSGSKIMESTQHWLSKQCEDVVFHRHFSDDPALLSKIRHIGFDLIYVDGNHDFKYVERDLANYYPLLTRAGVLIGDDFQNWGVQLAVKAFAKEKRLEFGTHGSHAGQPKLFSFVKPNPH